VSGSLVERRPAVVHTEAQLEVAVGDSSDDDQLNELAFKDEDIRIHSRQTSSVDAVCPLGGGRLRRTGNPLTQMNLVELSLGACLQTNGHGSSLRPITPSSAATADAGSQQIWLGRPQ